MEAATTSTMPAETAEQAREDILAPVDAEASRKVRNRKRLATRAFISIFNTCSKGEQARLIELFRKD
jgi:hypothetical protein